MLVHTSLEDLGKMEQRYRAQLINSVGGFKSVCLIGTTDANQLNNLAIFSSIVHIGANPPLICFVMRPDSVERHTLSNILETGYYTTNHLNEQIHQQAHQTSARYAKNESEFAATGLTPELKDNFIAPYVAESSIQLGVCFKQKIDLTINNTILIIGEIQHIYYPSNCLCTDGFLDIEKAGTITCSGLDSYHTTTVLHRLSYAKVDMTPTILLNQHID
jgi:flavin reductase (DIM6/NTAB) family NADH-FMN oxidoreductase RutF